MRITDLLPEERPRERLLANGADSLTDAELVAILLRSGIGPQAALSGLCCEGAWEAAVSAMRRLDLQAALAASRPR